MKEAGGRDGAGAGVEQEELEVLGLEGGGGGGGWAPVAGLAGSVESAGDPLPATYVSVCHTNSLIPPPIYYLLSLSEEVSQEAWSSGQHR